MSFMELGLLLVIPQNQRC